MTNYQLPITNHLINAWQKLTVLVIGEAMLDSFLMSTSSRLCQEAPVPVVDISDRRDVPGGAANTAANIASLGAKAVFLSVVGDDNEGDRLKRILRQRGIATEYLLTASRATLAKQRVFAASQLVVRFDQGSTEAIAQAVEQELIERLVSLFPECDAVIVSDYGYGILTPRIIKTLAKLRADRPGVLIVDSKRLEAYREVGATAVKPNYDEAILLLNLPKLTGSERIKQIEANGAALLTLTGAKLAAVTLDADGAIIFERDHPPFRTEATPVSNIGATGAGDTYASAFTLALAVGADSQTAASLAAAATAVVVSQVGTTACSAVGLRQFLSGKLIDRADLALLMKQLHATRKRIVFTNGCFDILHSGHVTYLEQAAALGDILIIGVNSDESVRGLKGASRPINALGDRLTVLSALASVDYVVPFAESTPIELIKIVRPDIYVKGGDYTPQTLPEAPIVQELGGVVKILPFVSDRSTTSLINRIRQEDQ